MGLMLKKIKRNQKIPFGIFLAASGIMVWQFGNQFFVEIINLAFLEK
jgi:leader peptidase (prepilin peptidase)/N-methyltransferase